MFLHVTNNNINTIGCENAWQYFGGIPEILIFDNLTPVVDKADRYSPRINKTFMEYA